MLRENLIGRSAIDYLTFGRRPWEPETQRPGRYGDSAPGGTTAAIGVELAGFPNHDEEHLEGGDGRKSVRDVGRKEESLPGRDPIGHPADGDLDRAVQDLHNGIVRCRMLAESLPLVECEKG